MLRCAASEFLYFRRMLSLYRAQLTLRCRKESREVHSHHGSNASIICLKLVQNMNVDSMFGALMPTHYIVVKISIRVRRGCLQDSPRTRGERVVRAASTVLETDKKRSVGKLQLEVRNR